MTQYSGVYSLQTQGQAITSGQWATDPYYKNTTLLLHADGVAGGAQNNTFLDSSTNAFAITRNGNTTQGSFTPYGPTWSNYFTGSNYLNTISSANLGMGTGDFTIEAWIYVTSAFSGYQTIFGDGNTTGAVFFGNTPAGFGLRSVSVGNILVTTAPAINTWVHVAICRSGSSNRLFYNGVQQSTTVTDSTNFATQSGYVGGDNGGSNFVGYISNLRVVKGTALYTSNFNPSTAPLTAVTNTQLLTCQSNRFIDNSSNTFSFTVTGSPSVQRFSPFAPQYQYTPAVIGGSGYFDGTGDYLSWTGTALSTGDFTAEAWIYPTSFASSFVPFAFGTSDTSGHSEIIIQTNGSILWYASNTTRITSSSGAIVANAWQHIAVCRSSGTTKLFVNGVQVGSNFTDSLNYTATSFLLGTGYGGIVPINGYVSNFRQTNSALYTTTFTPSTTPLTAVSGTQTLFNMTNAGIYDNAMMNDLETVGNAQVSTSVFKYGSGSLYFDGSGDYLSSTPQAGQFGTGDFTVEAWVNTSATATEAIVSLNHYNSNGWSLGVNYPSAGNFFWYSNTATILSATGVALNTWYHVAVCRSSGMLSIFVNGILRATAANTTNYSASSSLLVGNDISNQYFNGYIDDLRITKGVARYTGNFIPPKVAFANQ